MPKIGSSDQWLPFCEMKAHLYVFPVLLLDVSLGVYG